MDDRLLLFRAATKLCALPLCHVVEILRPLPIEQLPDMPAFVAGASLIRGLPTPIVDAGVLLDGARLDRPARLVSVRTPSGRVAGLLASEVLGIRDDTQLDATGMPPLLSGSPREFIATLARLDEEFLAILDSGRLVPEPIWERMSISENSR